MSKFQPRTIEDTPQAREYAISKSLKFLSFRPRSEKEVREFLKKKGFLSPTIEPTIERLTELKFLNDEDFARWWTEQRQKSRGRGKIVIKQELAQKGIERVTVDETLGDAQDDYKTAKEVFEKYKHRYVGMEFNEYYRKAGGFLQRRGFSWDVVKKILDQTKPKP
jgi:regulatory protein